MPGAGRFGGRDAPYRATAIILLLYFATCVLSLAPVSRELPERPAQAYAPGYFADQPRVGMARIIPISGGALKSPAVSEKPDRQ
ncbi:MAG: hypothetical protein K2H64_08705 [Desulfovibrio sp.]|nr:hypothetical protein [Desulfovibrio sp.]